MILLLIIVIGYDLWLSSLIIVIDDIVIDDIMI